MARTVPSPTSTRTLPTFVAPGGGGGGNAWEEWVEEDLSAIPGGSGDWAVILGSGATSVSATVTHSGGLLNINFPDNGGSAYNIRQTGSTMNGIWLIKKIHLNPWANQAKPASENAQTYQPESTLLKVEMAFDTTTGPIDTNGLASQHGYKLLAGCGLSQYSSDQSGNPALPGADSYMGAYVTKNIDTANAATTSMNAFRAGMNGYNIQASSNNGTYKWRGQSGADATNGFDAIVFQAGINTRINAKTGVQVCVGGGYATAAPFNQMIAQSNYNTGNDTKFSNDQYLHLAMWFGATSNTSKGGIIRIRRVRTLLQPLSALAPLE